MMMGRRRFSTRSSAVAADPASGGGASGDSSRGIFSMNMVGFVKTSSYFSLPQWGHSLAFFAFSSICSGICLQIAWHQRYARQG